MGTGKNVHMHYWEEGMKNDRISWAAWFGVSWLQIITMHTEEQTTNQPTSMSSENISSRHVAFDSLEWIPLGSCQRQTSSIYRLKVEQIHVFVGIDFIFCSARRQQHLHQKIPCMWLFLAALLLVSSCKYLWFQRNITLLHICTRL